MSTPLPAWIAAHCTALSLLFLLCIPMHIRVATVGSPERPQDLARDVRAACTQGATTVVITPGTYQLKDCLVFERLTGVELDFSKAELVQCSGVDGQDSGIIRK